MKGIKIAGWEIAPLEFYRLIQRMPEPKNNYKVFVLEKLSRDELGDICWHTVKIIKYDSDVTQNADWITAMGITSIKVSEDDKKYNDAYDAMAENL